MVDCTDIVDQYNFSAADCCECGDEPSGFIRCEVDIHHLSDQNFLKILFIRATVGIPILPFFHSFQNYRFRNVDFPDHGVPNFLRQSVTHVTVGRFAGRTCKNHSKWYS
jgi:hypothetical protein